MTMRVTLIHNPTAGDNGHPAGEELTELIRAAGHEVRYLSSTDGSWTRALTGPCDLIAIAGGDGTAGRIAKQLVGCGLPVTFLPVGTANNISKTLGLSGVPLKDLIAGWEGGTSRWLDVGVIDSPWGRKYFIEGVGMGLFVRTMLEIDALDALAHLDSAKDKVAHALGILSERLDSFPARHLSLVLDGKDLSGEYIMLEVMNIRFVGPNLFVAPTGDPADGLLDVVLISDSDRASMKEYLAHWQNGTLLPPRLTTHKGKRLWIEWHGSVLHVDDEAWPPDDAGSHAVPAPIEIYAKARALEVILPR
ncbi:MAG: diacylglycerol kinase family protein [Polyangia bacterium]